MAVLDTLQIFHGEVHPARARLYARLPRRAEWKAWRLTGRVTGPHNALAATLPATVRLRDLGDGPTLLAEAFVPDPCFWSPESPALYDVQVALVDEQGKERETATPTVGIRSFGIRVASFYLEGKRWVLRGASRAVDPEAPASQWREAWCSPLAGSRDDVFLEEASRLGVLTVAAIAGERTEVETELRRLARWPAVAIALIDCPEPLDASIASAAPNILLGCRMSGSEASPPDWANVIFGDVEDPREFANRFTPLGRPVIAMRPLDSSAGLHGARTACDLLQSDLAPHGDFAGYLAGVPLVRPPRPREI
jgi:hypothetical protein